MSAHALNDFYVCVPATLIGHFKQRDFHEFGPKAGLRITEEAFSSIWNACDIRKMPQPRNHTYPDDPESRFMWVNLGKDQSLVATQGNSFVQIPNNPPRVVGNALLYLSHVKFTNQGREKNYTVARLLRFEVGVIEGIFEQHARLCELTRVADSREDMGHEV